MFRYDFVKFPWNGEIRYGIAQNPEYDQGKHFVVPEGHAYVEDAIRPTFYLVPESDLAVIKQEFGEYDHEQGRFVGCDEWQDFVQNEEAKARALSASLPPGVHPGAMFTIGVADGYAAYVVTAVKGRKCTVEWRGFCLDHYYDHHFRSGGTFPVSEIERYVRMEQRCPA